MPKYRLTSLLPAALLLAFLPALAAYPFDLPVGDGIAMPFLVILTILFISLRYPDLLPSPLVFASGLACDLFTGAPAGFWSLLFLLALAGGRSLTPLAGQHPILIVLFFLSGSGLACAAAWALACLYDMNWQQSWKYVRAMITASILFPLPALMLIMFEDLLILRDGGKDKEGPFSPSARHYLNQYSRQRKKRWP